MVTETHLHREIHEQPDVLRRLLTAEREPVEGLAQAIREREVSHVVIAARGTSDNAGCSVAATKTYTAELTAVALLSAVLSGDAERLSAQQDIPKALAESLGMDSTIAAIAPRYRYMTHCVVIDRGYNYATAFELALKMKELTYSVVEPYSSADFLHVPLPLPRRVPEWLSPIIAIISNGVGSMVWEEDHEYRSDSIRP